MSLDILLLLSPSADGANGKEICIMSSNFKSVCSAIYDSPFNASLPALIGLLALLS